MSRSTTEAEYRSLTDTTSEFVWIKMIMEELNIMIPSPLKAWCDNMGAFALSGNPTHHINLKHVATNYHFVRFVCSKRPEGRFLNKSTAKILFYFFIIQANYSSSVMLDRVF